MDLAATLAAVTAAKDFASLIIGRKVDSAVTEKAIELQSSIIALQTGLLEMQAQIQTLTQKNQNLTKALAAVRNWEIEDSQHQLHSPAKGVYVVAAKAADASVLGSVWYCANCWQKQFKSALQRVGQDYGGTNYQCPNCSAKVYDHSDQRNVTF
jgi:DNA-directed RNA polymerase subunit RPC12/RpoP